MPLDPRARRFLDLLAATNPPSALSLSVAERRAALIQLLSFAGKPAPVAAVNDRTVVGAVGTLPARLYSPLAAPEGRGAGVVYFHGGGLVAGSIATHDPIARALASASGCRVLSIGYRLAPEAPFPAAIDDAVAAIDHVRARPTEFGFDPERLVVVGDSAGATLVAVACQRLAGPQRPMPRLQVLLCPILDYAGETRSRSELATGYLVDAATLAHDLRYYLPAGADVADPRVSPLRAADLSGAPPTAIHSAEFDPLRDEAKAYSDRLQDAGVPVDYTCHAGMIHLFYGLAGVIPYASTALQMIGAEIRAAVA